MKGYKVFNPDWTCKGKQYSCPGVFEQEGKLEICKNGIHFCKKLSECFNYYDFNPNNKVAEVEAIGEVIKDTTEKKYCTSKIKIVKELTWHEVLNLVNIGNCNTGFGNSGDGNTGDYNTGDYNSGYLNSGYHNSGNYNTGYYNDGDYNSGNHNIGDCNSGNYNSGYYNSGNRNSGNYNSGYRNSGNYNSGNYNSGNCNSGNCNTGDYNTGDWNKTLFSSGVFNNLEEENIRMFNKPSKWTYRTWKDSQAKYILENMPITKSNKEELDKARQEWWNVLPDIEKEIVLNLPNFDKKVFEDITGIDVNKLLPVN